MAAGERAGNTQARDKAGQKKKQKKKKEEEGFSPPPSIIGPEP